MSKLNNARIITFGTYRAVWNYVCVDAKRKIWKGRPMPFPAPGGKPSLIKPPDNSWLFFSRAFNEQNDWDRYYPEIEFLDLEIAGVPFLLVPKEKQLFGYEPPTVIELPPVGSIN